MLIKRYRGVFDFLCAAVPVKFFGSLLAGGVWVISDLVGSLAPGLKGLNSWAKGIKVIADMDLDPDLLSKY